MILDHYETFFETEAVSNPVLDVDAHGDDMLLAYFERALDETLRESMEGSLIFEQPGLNVPVEEEKSILAEYAEPHDDILDDSVFAPAAIPILLVACP